MTHIGRLEGYGIAKEATRGTAVDPVLWVQQTEATFEDMVENVQDESALGVLMTTSESERTKQYAEGEISGILASNSSGFFLLSLLGSVSTTSLGGGAYQHEFSMNNINSKPSLTISKKTPIGGQKFALAMVSALGISANVGEQVIMKAGLKAKASSTASLTKTYTADNKFYSKHLTIKLADTLAGLDAASALCIENIELNLTQELEDGFCFSSGVDLGDIFNKGFAIDGTFTKVKQDTTYHDYFKNGTVKAMRIEAIDTSTTIGTASNPTVRIDIAKVTFDEYENDGGLDDIMRENITFKGHYDLTNGSDIDVTLINTQSSY